MNCSGKHAAMLASCVAAGWPTASYRDPDHPLQVEIRREVERLAGEPVTAIGVDGCGAPLLAISVAGLATRLPGPGAGGAGFGRAAGRRRDAGQPGLDLGHRPGRRPPWWAQCPGC